MREYAFGGWHAPSYDWRLCRDRYLTNLHSFFLAAAMCPAVERLTDEAVQSLLREK